MSQKLTRRQFMVLSGASMAALALNSCASTPPAATTAAPTSSEPQRGGVLRIGLVDMLNNLDPWLVIGYVDMIWQGAVYEPLVHYTSTFQLEPVLATHWETSADGLTWTFHLRPDVIFHDGSPLTAEDVVHTFTQVLKPDSGYTGGKILSFVEKVVSTSPNTIEFTLNKVNVDFPILLADPLSSFNIVPRSKTLQELMDKPTGTGPFKVKEVTLGDSASLVRNENYWVKNLPHLDELRLIYIPEMATQLAALTSGELDVMWQIDTESVTVLEKTPRMKVAEVPHGYYCPILMSVAQKPFDDVRVRQAMKYLVNREIFVKTVLQGRGEIWNDQPIVPETLFSANLPAYPFDIAKAKALLAEAGYPNGFETTLATTDSFAHAVEGAVVFQEMAKQAGVTINLKQISADNYWTEYLTYPMAMAPWFRVATANQVLSLAYHSNGFYNETGLHDEVLDGLIDAALGETNEAKRQELYTQAQQRIQTEGAVIIPYVSSIFYAHHEKVQGIIYPPNMTIRAHTAWLKPA